MKVVLGARRKKELKNIVTEIRKDGGEAVFLETDVAKKTDMIALVALWRKNFWAS